MKDGANIIHQGIEVVSATHAHRFAVGMCPGRPFASPSHRCTRSRLPQPTNPHSNATPDLQEDAPAGQHGPRGASARVALSRKLRRSDEPPADGSSPKKYLSLGL